MVTRVANGKYTFGFALGDEKVAVSYRTRYRKAFAIEVERYLVHLFDIPQWRVPRASGRHRPVGS